MVDIAVVGAAGRMGGALIRAIAADEELSLSCALEHGESIALGKDAGEVANIGLSNIAIADSPKQQPFDIMIDFSTPASTLLNIEFCQNEKRAIVIGTTGMNDAVLAKMRLAAKTIPVMYSANYSVGVNLTAKLVEMATKIIGEESDIELVEAHHKHKVDAPSGTSLLLGNVIANSLGASLEDRAVFSREGIIGERAEGSIGFSTIRGGDLAGEHTVIFFGASKRLEITHRATDRKIFANGALKAAKWLSEKPAGLYDMNDVLGLSD